MDKRIVATAVCLAFASMLLPTQLPGRTQREVAAPDTTRIGASPSPPGRDRILDTYGALPLRFEVNRGQADPAARFVAQQPGYMLALAPAAAAFALKPAGARSAPRAPLPAATAERRPHSAAARTATSATILMKFVGAGADASLEGIDRLTTRSNYFIGSDPKRWLRGIENYGRVKATGVYPGIDVVYYGGKGSVEYDLLVAPGADPAQIRLGYDGVSRLRVDERGDLVLHTPGGDLVQHKPVAYQEIAGRRHPVDARYTITAHRGVREVGLRLASYDRTQRLVIDPVLDYSTYLGGSGWDEANGIAVDALGNAYVTGFTASNGAASSAMFPTSPPLMAQAWTDAVFVAQITAAGTLGYSTIIGGAGAGDAALGTAITVDAQQNVYVTGSTTSKDFPVLGGPVQPGYGGGSVLGDAFIVRLDAAGVPTYSTFLGGGGDDIGNGIALDPSGSVYVTGSTASSDFPRASAQQSTLNGAQNAFIAKLTIGSGTSSLAYSTYLGGSGSDAGRAIAVDGGGNAYVTGNTLAANPAAPDFPVTIVPPTYKGGTAFGDAFVAKLTTSGTLAYSTYLGGSQDDVGYAIAVDGAGSAYITGATSSSDFPLTSGSFQGALGAGGTSAFVTKLDPSGSAASYSTYLGGNGADQGYGIAVDIAGNIYVLMFANSSNLPVQSALAQAPAPGGSNGDFYLAKLNISSNPASPIVFATYLGGVNGDQPYAIAVDGAGNMYVAGVSGYDASGGRCTNTGTTHFPMVNPIQGTPGSCSDAVVAKIAVTATTVALDSSAPVASAGQAVTFTATVTGTTPTGTVVFEDNGAALGAPVAVASGTATTATATFSTSGLSSGQHSITAVYSGDTNNGPSVSAALPQSVGSSGGGGGGGCTAGHGDRPFDPLLPLMLVLAAVRLARRRER